jgi:hypothetical protein
MRDLLFKCPECAASLAFDCKLAGKTFHLPPFRELISPFALLGVCHITRPCLWEERRPCAVNRTVIRPPGRARYYATLRTMNPPAPFGGRMRFGTGVRGVPKVEV